MRNKLIILLLLQLFLSLLLSVRCPGQAENSRKLNVIVIFAHPDEGEIYAGGISAIYSQLGHRVKFLSLTNGDAGHWSMVPAELAKRRYKEAMESKRILGLTDYEILGYHDGNLANTKEIQKIVAANIEEWNADIVILFYPITSVKGGHNDNMQAGHIVKDAAALLKMKNMPAFLFMRDYFTTDFSHIPDIAINIGEVWDTKLLAMKAHESQVVESNPHADGVLDEVLNSEIKRQEYLFYNSYPYSRVTPDIKFALEKWYGREESENIKWAEAFQFAEFGRQIDDKAINELFPMLGYAFIVDGTSEWLDTGIDLSVGDILSIRSEGEVVWKKEGFNWCDPNGNPTHTRWGNRPVLESPVGALIGKIGPEKYTFMVGDYLRIEACAEGRLYLGINDDNVKDNAGFFNVRIKPVKSEKP